MTTSVCLSLCLSVCPRRYLPNHTCDLRQILCMLPMAVARSSSDRVTKSQGAMLGIVFSTDNELYRPYCGMNFAMKDRSCLNLLIYRKVGQNSISEY